MLWVRNSSSRSAQACISSTRCAKYFTRLYARLVRPLLSERAPGGSRPHQNQAPKESSAPRLETVAAHFLFGVARAPECRIHGVLRERFEGSSGSRGTRDRSDGRQSRNVLVRARAIPHRRLSCGREA